MKKLNNLAAAVAVALSLGAAPQANAVIEMHSNGLGDALIFPAFNGYIENYFTISNTANAWVQGHIRFRGAAWSGELRDFDVILSPGDVLVFRLADVDGDGQWEIDQSMDSVNFEYTGMLFNCGPEGSTTTTHQNCLDSSLTLIPTTTVPSQGLTEAVIEHHRHIGYIEFFGEAVLDNLTHTKMNRLLTIPGEPFQTQVFGRTGTTAWMWSDAANNFVLNQGLSDVPNALAGSAFISVPGQTMGLAYNAEALVNFRTSSTDHRIDNYPGDNAVILHDENGAIDHAAGTSPFGDYVYWFSTDVNAAGSLEDDIFEARISFNNTWGPTLADGDDYDMSRFFSTKGNAYERDVDLRPVGGAANLGLDSSALSVALRSIDDWDDRMGATVSIAEVEEAIRVGGQTFHGFYFDGANFGTRADLTSMYFAHFPTKFYYGERSDFYGTSRLTDSDTLNSYLGQAVVRLLELQKYVLPQVWDTQENFITGTPLPPQATPECISPSTFEECFNQPGVVVLFDMFLGFELTLFDISYPKDITSGFDIPAGFEMGRVVLDFPNNSPFAEPAFSTAVNRSWPGMIYTFEFDGAAGLGHWRPLQRH